VLKRFRIMYLTLSTSQKGRLDANFRAAATASNGLARSPVAPISDRGCCRDACLISVHVSLFLWNVDNFNSCACGDVWTCRFLCSAWRALPTPEVLQAADMVWVPPGCRSRRLPQADNRPSAGRSAPMLKTLRQPAAQR
jgi:hypothetical protein